MPSDATPTTIPGGDGTPPYSQDPSRQRMGSRERRRKIIWLALLIALLAALAFLAYYFVVNKRLPIPGIAPTSGTGIQPPEYLFSITGSGANALKGPVGVAVGKDQRVYVVDFSRRRISVFNKNGGFLFAFDQVADGANTQLGNPVHIAMAPDGNLWVADRRNKAVYIFSAEGDFLRKFVPNGNEDFDWTPLAIAIASDGSVRITDVGDTAKHRLLYFDAAGNLTKQVGRTAQVVNPEDSPGYFYFPNGLAIADDGSVYVADGDNRRVQVFDTNGTFKQFVSTSGVPRGEAIDNTKDYLFVVDALAHQVDIYSLKGENLGKFGERGFGPGQFNYPNDIALMANRIYITDRMNDQVQVWGWPTGGLPPIKAPSTPLGWLACLSPLLLLPLLLLLRRRRFAVTEDFVGGMIATEYTQMLGERRFRFVVPEAEHARYEGRVVDGVDLGQVIKGETHSDSDARAIQQRLEVDEATAILLAIAQRTKGLCTEDERLRRLAVLLEIDVYDVAAFLARFRKTQGSPGAHETG